MQLNLLDIPNNKIKQFEKKNIYTVEDLVQFFPKKYYDLRFPLSISKAVSGEVQSFIGRIYDLKSKNNGSFINVKIGDGSGRYLYVSWFNMPFMLKQLRYEQDYFIAGQVTLDEGYGILKMVNPMFFDYNLEKNQRIVPVYSKIKGMSTYYFEEVMNSAIAITDKFDYLEPVVRNKFGLIKLSQAIRKIHSPESMEDIEDAKKRILFDDLFLLAMELGKNSELTKESSYIFTKKNQIKNFLSTLPFELTDGQSEALRTMYKKLFSGERLHALVQGDVGAGKTIVAIILMFMAWENGYQSALMAPTTVLAKQHYEELGKLMEPFGIKVGYLSGDLKAKEKRMMLQKIKDGDVSMVVGTHSVIQKDVVFKNLAMTIVDEEHRFGVKQRELLRQKASLGVHGVSMSATPIPRTLALTVYGDDVDVMTIKNLPKGRKPITTVIVKSEQKAYEGMYRQISQGHQCYVICPLIEDSDSEVMEGVDSVETTFKKLVEYFAPYPKVKIGVINGKMDQKEINEEISKFANKEYDIIVSTTIVEVGVNVPNATVIMIKNAERFGLSQLHQLRGRVGRGSHQSYCVLQSGKKNPKLEVMTRTTDGFEIAKKDLEFRGMGDFIGTKQSGDNKHVMLMLANPSLYDEIKKEVSEIYKSQSRTDYYKPIFEEAVEDMASKSHTVKKVIQ